MLVALIGVAFGANAKKKETQVQPVYMFGVSMSFADSMAYVTDIMLVDSAYLTPKGFLADRQLYSLQLEAFMSEKMNVPNTMNAVFFDVKKKNVEKKYDRVRRLYLKSNSVTMRHLQQGEFVFKAEEYVAPIELDDSAEEAVQEEKNKKKAKKKDRVHE